LQMVLQSHETSAELMTTQLGGNFEQWIKNGTPPDTLYTSASQGSPSLLASRPKRKATR
jgi:hypothetical protein